VEVAGKRQEVPATSVHSASPSASASHCEATVDAFQALPGRDIGWRVTPSIEVSIEVTESRSRVLLVSCRDFAFPKYGSDQGFCA